MTNRNIQPVIECSGSDYDIGRQYGEQARDNLRKALALMYKSMKLMPYQAERNAVEGASRKYLDNVRTFDPGALDRVKGMSEGAGIPFEDIFALQCFSELFVNYPGLAGMCTSFAVTGPATKKGITILGQNIDWHPDSAVDIARIKRTDGVRMLGIFLNGYGGVYLTSDGMGNSANMTLCPPAAVRDHIPFAFYLYAAMREKSAGDAMGILRRTARGVGYVHVADGMGSISGIESVYDDYAILEPVRGVLIHANHYETDKYKKIDGAYTYIPDSFKRADRLRALIDGAYGSVTPEMMMSFLSDHEGYPKSVCTHVDPGTPPVFASLSVASVVMVPGEGKMFISSGSPCENGYSEYLV